MADGHSSIIKVRRLPFGDTTAEGPFFAQVNGINIGENSRAFWTTAFEAREAAERWLDLHWAKALLIDAALKGEAE